MHAHKKQTKWMTILLAPFFGTCLVSAVQQAAVESKPTQEEEKEKNIGPMGRKASQLVERDWAGRFRQQVIMSSHLY